MSRDYQDTVDLLQQRVRESGNVAVTQNTATEILGRCERFANAYLRRITATSNFSSVAYTSVYDYRATLTSAIDIISITESNRPLLRCDTLLDLSALDPDWFRYSIAAASHRFEAYCQLSRDTLILYPAKRTSGTNDLSVTYTKLLTGYATYAAASGNNMSLPDEDVEFALGLAEVVLLSRARRLDLITPRLKQLARTVGLEVK